MRTPWACICSAAFGSGGFAIQTIWPRATNPSGSTFQKSPMCALARALVA